MTWTYLTIKTGGDFSIYAYITAGNFTATVGTYFNNDNTINATSFTATIGEDFNSIQGKINADSITITAKNFYSINNTAAISTINATSFTVTIAEDFNSRVWVLQRLMQIALLLQQ